MIRRLALTVAAAFLWVSLSQSTAPAEESEAVHRNVLLPPGPGNPRNSEGDFAALKDGRIIFVYTHFTGGYSDQATAHLVARYSSDGGKTWTRDDVTVIENEGTQNVMSVSLLRLQSGKLALAYLRKNSIEDCRPVLRISTDEARTWGDPIDIIAGEVGYYILNNDRLVQLGSGRLLAPVALHNRPGYEKPEWTGRLMCYLSDDSGETWRRSSAELLVRDKSGKRVTVQEPGVVELRDGRLMMFARSPGRQYVSYSTDGGDHWSPLKPSNIHSPVSPATIERIPSTGDLLLVWNNHANIPPELEGKRTPYNAAISRDDGATWENIKTLEDDPGGWYCYTAMDFVDDRVLLSHSAGNRRTTGGLSVTQITSFPVSWLYSGAQEQTSTVAGPLLGHVTAETATVWMFVPAGSKAELSYGMEGDDAKKMVAAFEPIADPAVPAQEAGGMPVIAKLDGLQPETAYGYSIQVGGKSSPLWAGTFRSAAPTGKPGKFRVALTSCMKIGQPQASWFLLLAQQPDLHLTVGDTQYSDTTQPEIQWQHHLRYRREKEFATVLRQVPTYSMWDDHDYGPNNSDGTAKGKENSLHGWKQIWANPAAGTAEVPGAFYKFGRGEVDFFVVDGRYHRSPDEARDDEEKRMLGDAQFNWLIEGLKSSKAKFKVIASGSTLQESEGDGWRIYTFARHRLLDAIKAESISGVMYFSGDVHLSLVRQHHESDRVGYPLIEVISSGIANSKTLSFATIDFDTASEDPSVRVRIIHGDGTVRDDKSWSLSQLGGS